MLRHIANQVARLHGSGNSTSHDVLNLLFGHTGLHGADALRLGLVGLDFSLVVLPLLLLRLDRLGDVLQHLVHLLHLLPHRLNLLIRGFQGRIFVVVLQQFGVNRLLQTFCHLLSTRPVHVLHKQVTSHLPQLRVALQNLRHGLHRLLTLGHVRRASGYADIVLADRRVVDFLNHNAVFIHDFADRLGLLRVNPRSLRLTVNADDAGNALGVVNLGDKVNKLARDVADGASQVVNVVVCAGVALPFTRQNCLAGTLVRGRANA